MRTYNKYLGTRLSNDPSMAERLAHHSMPEPNTGCQLWISHLTKHGYGKLTVHWKALRAHVEAYKIKHGPVPTGMCVCHKCDVRSCINPDHLFLGTIADNVADMDAKGRRARGPRRYVRLTADNVATIRASHLTPTDLAAQYDVRTKTVYAVLARRTWKHV